MKKYILITAFLGIFNLAAAMASGCDQSCWSIERTIVKEFGVDKEFFTFEISQEKGSLTAKQKPEDLPYEFPSPIEFKGTYYQTGLAPRLLERLSNENWSGTLSKKNMKFVVTDYNGGQTEFQTGQLVLEVLFETGESITLYSLPVDQLVDHDSGWVIEENLLPLFNL